VFANPKFEEKFQKVGTPQELENFLKKAKIKKLDDS